MILAGWINEEQRRIIDFQRTEIDILKDKLGYKRIILDDDQRHRLAVKGKLLGRKLLAEIGCLFTPDTILRWHRELIAKKWEGMLRKAVAEFLAHYHAERNHQGLGNRIPMPGEEVGRPSGEIECRARLGGLLRYYHRQAA